MSNEPTGGEWSYYELPPTYDGLGYIRTDVDNLEIAHHGDEGRSPEENRANGHLMAASKRMLAALELARAFVKEELDVRIDSHTLGGLAETLDEDGGMIVGEAADMLVTIDAVIRMAKGEV